MTRGPQLDPLPDGVLDKLRQVSTSTVATQLFKRGYRQPQLLGVRPLSQVADGFVAEAFTMRFIPAREDVNTPDPYRSGNTLQWEAFEECPPGQVLVVDSRGDASAASGGDMLMTRAWKRGVAGFVTDGGLRDGHVLSQLPFPTYAAAVTITTRAAWHHVADLQVPIGCAGVAVYPGDVLVADRDGIIVVPRALAAEIADPSLEQEQLEAYVSTKIHAGEPLWGNYPPGEETIAEYKASLGGPPWDVSGSSSSEAGSAGWPSPRSLDGADVDVTVVDRTNHHLFQPLLYQVAAGHPVARPDRAGAAQRDQEAAQRQGAAGRRVRPGPGREGGARARAGRPGGRPALRHPGGRGRGHPLLLRQGPLRRVRPGHEDHRGRPVHPGRDPVEVRDGRDRHRPAGTGRVADLRRDRGRPDRRRAGRADRRAGAHRAAPGLPLGRHPGGADHPARGRAVGAAAVPGEAAELHQEAPGADGRRDPGEHPGHRHGPRVHHGQGPGRARDDPRPHPDLGRRRAGLAAGEDARREGRAWRPTGPAGSR